MPYITPTATELKARYPEFATVSDTLVNFAIGDAGRFVDTGWFENDYQRAIMALAAHFLLTDGVTGAATGTTGLIQSERLGDASITYANAGGSYSTEFSSSAYGRAFLRFQRVNVPAVHIL